MLRSGENIRGGELHDGRRGWSPGAWEHPGLTEALTSG